MSALSAFVGRVDRPTVRRFLVGDLLAILAFVVLGELQHGFDPATQWPRFVATGAQFLVGWAVVGPLAGAYAARTAERRLTTVAVTFLAWVGATLLAQALRATALFPGNADPVFFLVTVGVGGALLLGWRLLRSLAD